MMNWLKEKGAEYFGKVGIAGGVGSEVGKASGYLENVSALQLISAAGIVWLLVDRSMRLIWDAKEKGMFGITIAIQVTMWVILLSLLAVVF